MRQCYETVEKQGRERGRSDAQLYGQLAVLQSRAAPSFDSVPPIIVADHLRARATEGGHAHGRTSPLSPFLPFQRPETAKEFNIERFYCTCVIKRLVASDAFPSFSFFPRSIVEALQNDDVFDFYSLRRERMFSIFFMLDKKR